MQSASDTGTDVQAERANRDLRLNNFDLLRLFAASQVVYFHAVDNLELKASLLAPLSFFLHLFPGVPIFFVISGYLISMSYERTRHLQDYLINRFLRIYPALWVCFLSTLAAITVLGAWHNTGITIGKFVQWVVMQLTIGQFYSPHVVNVAYGVGHTNGSLWTIPVELQFYAAIPVLYYVLRRLRKPFGDMLILVLFSFFWVVSQLYSVYFKSDGLPYETAQMLIRVSLVPWFYMFLGGVLLQRNYSRLAPYLEGKGLVWLSVYLVIASVAAQYLGAALGNDLNLLLYMILAVTVLSLAQTKPGLSFRLLRSNDISYGTYIYHMVVINIIYELGYRGHLTLLPTVVILTYLVAYLSWKFVEKPALAAKRHPLRPVES